VSDLADNVQWLMNAHKPTAGRRAGSRPFLIYAFPGLPGKRPDRAASINLVLGDGGLRWLHCLSSIHQPMMWTSHVKTGRTASCPPTYLTRDSLS
jgi:hypothetical protein